MGDGSPPSSPHSQPATSSHAGRGTAWRGRLPQRPPPPPARPHLVGPLLKLPHLSPAFMGWPGIYPNSSNSSRHGWGQSWKLVELLRQRLHASESRLHWDRSEVTSDSWADRKCWGRAVGKVPLKGALAKPNLRGGGTLEEAPTPHHVSASPSEHGMR